MIFDVDGTLVDSNDAHAHAWVDAFAEDGITVAYDSVRRAIGMGGDKLMPAVDSRSVLLLVFPEHTLEIGRLGLPQPLPEVPDLAKP